MGTLFRSEEMTLCQFFLQAESAYCCVSELGELGLVQFRDLNPEVNAFQRKFTNEIRRCDEMERKLRFLQKQIEKDGIPMLDTSDNPPAPFPREMIDLEATFEKLESEMKEVNSNAEALKKNFLELTELKQILRKTHAFFDEMHETPSRARKGSLKSYMPPARPPPPPTIIGTLIDIDGASGHPSQPNTSSQDEDLLNQSDYSPNITNYNNPNAIPAMQSALNATKLGFVAGVITRERFPGFERLLWRACRGNVFLRRADIDQPLEDPVTGEKVYKVVFMIFFQGEQLRIRVKKICEAFRATLYPCPETAAERREMEMGVMTRLEDLSTVLSQTQEHRHRVLVAAAKNIKFWYIKVRKIKSIYHSLNMFSIDVTHKCLIAEGWCPVADMDKIRSALKRGEDASGSQVPCILNRMEYPENVTPPTFNRVTKYTAGFQNIVDAYGAAKYREVNPAPYTIVTFPFLFAVMFGDAGHGLILLIFGLWMVLRERQLLGMARSETFGIFYTGRYIVLGMGLFSIYTGILYNDVYSKSLNIFGSSWHANMPNYYIPPGPLGQPIQGWVSPASFPASNASMISVGDVNVIGLDPVISPRVFKGSPYPYGLDPIWQVAKNKITFANSYKMKISIIIGVIHMTGGIILSLFNHTYFRQPLNIWFEFIPQFLFLFCLFGYLCIVIIVKWIKLRPAGSKCAPSLLINLINMFLLSYPPQAKGDTCPQFLFKGQKTLQYALVIIALICVPWMLLPKPLLLRRKNKYFMKRKTRLVGQENPVVDFEHSTSPNVHGVRRLVKKFPWEKSKTPTGVATSSGHGLLSPNNVQNPAETSTVNDGSGGGRSSLSTRNTDSASGTATKNGSFSAATNKTSGPNKVATNHGEDGGEHKFNFGEIMIEQCIHTIEFCLGCLSHTASYLRLWALSLAHAQLSEVLWNMVFRVGFGFRSYAGCVVLYLVFAVWAVLTLAILIFMEGLSAFLHALRLHWVEFQSKFYSGTGYLFEPFSFQHILDSVALIGQEE